MLIRLYRMYHLKVKERLLLLCLRKGNRKMWKEKRKCSQEGQGQDQDQMIVGLKMEVSLKMSSIKGTITLTMIKEESKDTKE